MLNIRRQRQNISSFPSDKYLTLVLLLAFLLRILTKPRTDLRPALDVNPRASVHKGKVEDDVRAKDADIPPKIALDDVEAESLLKKLVTG